jgi:hypothetical protein
MLNLQQLLLRHLNNAAADVGEKAINSLIFFRGLVFSPRWSLTKIKFTEHQLVPSEIGCRLVFRHSCFEKVLFLSKINRFTHPRKWVFRVIDGLEADPL